MSQRLPDETKQKRKITKIRVRISVPRLYCLLDREPLDPTNLPPLHTTPMLPLPRTGRGAHRRGRGTPGAPPAGFRLRGNAQIVALASEFLRSAFYNCGFVNLFWHYEDFKNSGGDFCSLMWLFMVANNSPLHTQKITTNNISCMKLIQKQHCFNIYLSDFRSISLFGVWTFFSHPFH